MHIAKLSLFTAAVFTPMISFGENLMTVEYDVFTGTETMREIVSAEAPKADTASSIEGTNTGVRKGRTSSNISRSLMREFAKAGPAYAPYISEKPEEDDDRFSEYGIVDSDDRKVVIRTDSFPSSAIASILFLDDKGERKLCSGSMIADNALLTAGHCVFVNKWHQDFTVLSGRNVGRKPFEECGVEKILIFASWKELLPGQDLALLKLNCTIGTQTGYFSIRAFQDSDVGKTARLQGYPGEIDARGRQYYALDEITRADGFVIDHKIDTTGGMSGSPLWLDAEDAVFAVHTHSTFASGWSPQNSKAFINHATRMTPERIEVLRSWIDE